MFFSERSEEGWPATARPPVGVVGHGQVPCRGDHPRLGPYKGRQLRPGPLQGRSAVARALARVASYSQEPRKVDRMWLGPPARVAARKGQSPTGVAAHGQGYC
ncbi:hypothetical protein OPV22_021789 [Ensete ventricosum]|uniref:Uncharacterized protein n=1 Tax=Ensete ventricosum TaxID=4639 RepID=A0AAV8QHY4_ENSVE|nr:hypothetical protein OPV22_021789 [Ensete ventricosum]